MKKAISIILAALLLVAVVAVGASAADVTKDPARNGSCGENLTWTFNDGTKTLTVSGTGEMENYSAETRAPWYEHRAAMTSLVLEDGVSSIGSYAFNACKNLTSITFAGSVESIGDYAFFDCGSLAELTIPGTVKKIGAYAFGGAKQLTKLTLSDGVQEIGEAAFSGLVALTDVSIPGSVSAIGDKAFSADVALVNVTLGEGVAKIGTGAFLQCVALKEITLPASLTEIGVQGFSRCTALESITIPAKTETIGDRAFFGCTGLKSVKFEDGTKKTGVSAFSGCTALTSVDLGKTVETIDEGSFYGCSALKNVTIPASVRTLGKDAFSGCYSAEVEFENVDAITEFGYSDIWNSASKWSQYVTDITAGSFKYEDNEDYNGGEVDLSGYNSNAGVKNGDSLTWIHKSAKWVDTDMKDAELRVDFSYRTANNPTDIVFVLDYSGSMMDTVDGVSKFYTLISKVDDISKVLLNNEKLDNRIAIAPFSEDMQSYCDFTADYDSIHEFLFSQEPYGDTHYSEGFETAGRLITSRNDSSRDVIVIFVTDGAPNEGFEGVSEAKAITDAGHSLAGIVLDTTAAAYNTVASFCTNGMTYSADSNEELNRAINTALIASFASYLVLDDIQTENFEIKDVNLITVVDEDGNTYNDTVTVLENGKSIKWNTVGFLPEVTYTLTIPLVLKDGIYGTEIKTNDGDLGIVNTLTDERINTVASPVLNNVSAYMVIYHSNLSDNKSETFNFSSGDTVTVKDNLFTNEGYSFKGWNTKADGTGTAYKSGDTFVMPNNSVDLYAQWSANGYTVIYNSNNATGTKTNETVSKAYEYKSNVTVAENTFAPSEEKYVFVSWNTKADGTGKEFKPGETFTMPAQDVVLYAQWKNKYLGVEFGVIYDGNGGTYEEGKTEKRVGALYESTVEIEANFFDREGYNFVSWNTEPDGSGTSYAAGDTFVMGASDVRVYAQWQKKAAPKTGAEDNMMVWVIALAMAGAAATFTFLKKKKA